MVTIEQLEITPGGQFFTINCALKKAHVKRLFDLVRDQFDYKRAKASIIREKENLGSVTYHYSFLCFEYEEAPSFLVDSTLTERLYGFLLLIEIDGVLGIFKKGRFNIHEWMDEFCETPDRRKITQAFSDHATYEKLNLRRMSVSSYELHGCAYEASNLENSIPSLSLSRSIPNYIRLSSTGHGALSITPGTSRIRKLGQAVGIEKLAEFTQLVGAQLKIAQSHMLLDRLAVPIEVSALPQTVRPTGVLLDLGMLLPDGAGDGVQILLERPPKNGNGQVLEKDVTAGFRRRFRDVLELQPVIGKGDKWAFNRSSNLRGIVKRNDKSFSFSVETSYSLFVKEPSQEKLPLNKWLSKRNNFNICFNSHEFFYSQRHLYKRAQFASDIEQIESMIRPQSWLDTVTSEKGDTSSYTQQTTSFDAASIFYRVEQNMCATSVQRWCCDLGDEWADYMTIEPDNSFRFIHCKHDNVTGGASKLQDVIGQALKNLGRAKMLHTDFVSKANSITAEPLWGKTGIVRHVGSATVGDDIRACLEDYDRKCEVILVVSMLSWARFQQSVARTDPEAYFVQLIWLLGSFMNSCREKGAKPLIYCRQ